MPPRISKPCFLEDPNNAVREGGGFTLTQAGMALVGGQLENMPSLCVHCRKGKDGCFVGGDPPIEVRRPIPGAFPDKYGNVLEFKTFHLDRGLLDAENSPFWWSEP